LEYSIGINLFPRSAFLRHFELAASSTQNTREASLKVLRECSYAEAIRTKSGN
jgi:hypothetical protein